MLLYISLVFNILFIILIIVGYRYFDKALLIAELRRRGYVVRRVGKQWIRYKPMDLIENYKKEGEKMIIKFKKPYQVYISFDIDNHLYVGIKTLKDTIDRGFLLFIEDETDIRDIQDFFDMHRTITIDCTKIKKKKEVK